MAALSTDPLPSLTRAWRAFLLIAWVLLAGPAMATEPGTSPPAELRIHNQPVFQFRVSLMGYTPAERAAAARVEAALESERRAAAQVAAAQDASRAATARERQAKAAQEVGWGALLAAATDCCFGRCAPAEKLPGCPPNSPVHTP